MTANKALGEAWPFTVSVALSIILTVKLWRGKIKRHETQQCRFIIDVLMFSHRWALSLPDPWIFHSQVRFSVHWSAIILNHSVMEVDFLRQRCVAYDSLTVLQDSCCRSVFFTVFPYWCSWLYTQVVVQQLAQQSLECQVLALCLLFSKSIWCQLRLINHNTVPVHANIEVLLLIGTLSCFCWLKPFFKLTFPSWFVLHFSATDGLQQQGAFTMTTAGEF